MQIHDAIWGGGATGCVGIVKVEDEYEGIKYYIGAGFGEDEEADKKRIAEWGSTFPTNVGNMLFGC